MLSAPVRRHRPPTRPERATTQRELASESRAPPPPPLPDLAGGGGGPALNDLADGSRAPVIVVRGARVHRSGQWGAFTTYVHGEGHSL